MINQQSQSLRTQYEKLLSVVEKPSRYIGSELFSCAGGTERLAEQDGCAGPGHRLFQNLEASASEQLDVVLADPDVYEVGA